MKRILLTIFFIICLTRNGQDQEFVKSEITFVNVCQYDITLEDSVHFTIYPDHNLYTGWETEGYKNRMKIKK